MAEAESLDGCGAFSGNGSSVAGHVVNALEIPKSGYFIHVGSGVTAPSSWLNIDGSWNARAARIPLLRRFLRVLGLISEEASRYPWPKSIYFHDVARGLPVGDESAAAIYASHLFEHLSRQAARRFLGECWRVLKPGGRLRLVVPDMKAMAAQYLEERSVEPGGAGPADRFLERLNTCADREGLPWVMRVYRAFNDVITHKWMYDEASLVAALRSAGFDAVERKGYLQSSIPLIDQVEREESFQLAVCVEGVRPRAR